MAARSGCDGGARELVEHHGRRVADDDLAGCRAESCAADRIADEVRPLHPLVGPSADEARCPLPRDELLQPFGRGLERPAQGVPVKVGEERLLVGRHEATDVLGERIGGVELASQG